MLSYWNNDDSGSRRRRLLGMVLVSHGAVTPEEIEEALVEQERSGRLLGEVLIDTGVITRPALSRALAAQNGAVLEPAGGLWSGLTGAIDRRHELRREVRLRLVDPVE
jgi:hypothetical protein